MSIAITSLAVFAASQIGTPGPANMLLLATGARYGLRHALPFLFGVVFGKQLIIWPIGFGLMELTTRAPFISLTLKYISAIYIFWFAWKVAHMRLSLDNSLNRGPSFIAGLFVHPLNPKAWAMVVAAFTAFVAPETPILQATTTIAIVFLACQLLMHPLWTLAGNRIARSLAGTAAEPYLMYTLAAITVASVLFVLFGGGT